MDKKSIAAIAIVGLIIVGLVIFLFVGDTTSDTILTVGKVDYSVDDFISYVRAWQKDGAYTDFDTYVENNGDELKEGFDESDYINKMYSTYEIYKMYAQYADKLGVELLDGELPELTSGDTLESDYGITSGEYMRVETEIAKANKFFTNPAEYISGDENITASYISNNGYNPNKVYNTYKYRVVQLPVPFVEESESGDNSGENDRILAEAKEKANALLDLTKEAVVDFSGEHSYDEFQAYIAGKNNDVLNEVFANVFASGDDELNHDIFGYIDRAYSYQRYSQNAYGMSAVNNGDLDSVSALYMQEDLMSENSYLSLFVGDLYSNNVVPFLSKSDVGDFSDVFVVESSLGGDATVGFAYIEDIENKLSEADQNRFDASVLNYYIQSSVDLVQKNKSRINSLKLADIVPIIARNAEAKKLEEQAATEETVEPTIDVSVGSGE